MAIITSVWLNILFYFRKGILKCNELGSTKIAKEVSRIYLKNVETWLEEEEEVVADDDNHEDKHKEQGE